MKTTVKGQGSLYLNKLFQTIISFFLIYKKLKHSYFCSAKSRLHRVHRLCLVYDGSTYNILTLQWCDSEAHSVGYILFLC